MNKHVVAIQNMSALHAIALNFQQEGARWSPIFGKLNHVFDVFLRKQGQSSRDAAHYRYTVIVSPARRRLNGERSRLESLLLKEALPFQRRNVVLNSGRVNSEVFPDLTHGRRKAVAFGITVNEVQNGLLPFGQHG